MLSSEASPSPAAIPEPKGYGWIPLFRDVAPRRLNHLLRRCDVRRLSAGDDLLRPGQVNESLYILLRGGLTVYLTPEATEGQGIPIRPGHCIGEYSTIDLQPVSALVRCESEADVLEVSASFFWKRLVPLPGVARNMMRGLTERARTTNQLALKTLRERLELEQLRKEIDLARQLQAGMLPLRHPLFPDRTDLDVCARVEPADSVGGDFFDSFLTADDRLFVAIGDVSGHGIGAALLMARTIGLMRSLAMTASGPELVLQQLNAFLCEGNETSLFATVFCGYLDTVTGRFDYSNAGHLPPLLIRDSDFSSLPLPRGMMVGISERATYRGASIQLNRGDLLFAYTDGLSEAENDEGCPYGVDASRDLLCEQSQAPLPVLLDRLRARLDSFCGSRALEDDCTLLLLRRL